MNENDSWAVVMVSIVLLLGWCAWLASRSEPTSQDKADEVPEFEREDEWHRS